MFFQRDDVAPAAGEAVEDAAAPSLSTHEPPPQPEVVGRFSIGEKIGSGAFSEVFVGRDESTGVVVSLSEVRRVGRGREARSAPNHIVVVPVLRLSPPASSRSLNTIASNSER
jgi:serine/threonine protein kinase